MLGAIIGDIIGSRFEFHNTEDVGFALFDTECSFTDDTICTVAIADAILKGISYKDSVLSWCRKYPHPMGGYGGSFRQWLLSDNYEPYNSFGNGAAMRVSPVAWAFVTKQDVQRQAIETAAFSHNHPEGLIGAMSVAEAIFMLRREKKNKDLIVEGVARQYYGFHYYGLMPRKGVFDETCQRCVPLAFHIVEDSRSFDEAIRRAITWGGDSDTIGAIVGSMAEAKFGIDDELKTVALDFLPDDMKAVVNEFQEKYVRYQ